MSTKKTKKPRYKYEKELDMIGYGIIGAVILILLIIIVLFIVYVTQDRKIEKKSS